MEIQGIGWLGTRTEEFEATARFFGETMGLTAEHEEPDFAVFRLPNGDKVEVFGPSDRTHEHFTSRPARSPGSSWRTWKRPAPSWRKPESPL